MRNTISDYKMYIIYNMYAYIFKYVSQIIINIKLIILNTHTRTHTLTCMNVVSI